MLSIHIYLLPIKFLITDFKKQRVKHYSEELIQAKHFNFELAKDVATLVFVPDSSNFGQAYIYYRQTNNVLINFLYLY